MFYYDSDFHRQRQKERTAEMRADYQRAQAPRQSRAWAQFRNYARSAWSHMRWANPRRAPVFRA